jgi:hypothetical protein
MDLERNFILLNVINKLEKIQSDSNTSSCIYAALKEELKIIHIEENKTFINDACNYLVSSDCNSKGLKAQLSNLLIDKNNLEIYNFCHKLLKFT